MSFTSLNQNEKLLKVNLIKDVPFRENTFTDSISYNNNKILYYRD